MHIVQIGGNVGDEAAWFSTENAYRAAFIGMGHTVTPINQEALYQLTPDEATSYIVNDADGLPDLCLYTRTHNDTALKAAHTETWRTLEKLGVTTASVHLDVFWGLPERISWIQNGDPLFTTGTVFTADGGSERHWEELSINHVWLPAGADLRRMGVCALCGVPNDVDPQPCCQARADGSVESRPAERFEDLKDKIVFVGSEGYHKSWSHRPEMLAHLRKRYGALFVQYGGGTERGSVRGYNLERVYASGALVVGDFCFAGTRANYWSDRIPETLGRGGFLAVAYTPGMEEWYKDGIHLATWTTRDWATLDEQIERWLESPLARAEVAAAGRALVLSRDTYPHRAAQLLETVGLADR